MRLEHAAFLELEVFSRIGARLEASVEARLARGRRVRALFRQRREAPLGAFAELVRLALAADGARLVRVPEEGVGEAARLLEREVAALEPALAAEVDREPRLSSEDRARLTAAVSAVLDRAYPETPSEAAP